MTGQEINQSYLDVIEQVKALRLFYSHVFTYISVISVLFLINLLTFSGFFWVLFPVFGWGIAVILHGVNTFFPGKIFGAEWDKK